MAKDIPEVRAGDKAHTLLREASANALIRLVNSLKNMQIRPQGSGKLTVGSGGGPAVLELRPQEFGIGVERHFTTTGNTFAGAVPTDSEMQDILVAVYTDSEETPIHGDVIRVRFDTAQLLWYKVGPSAAAVATGILAFNFNVGGTNYGAINIGPNSLF